MFRDAGHHLRPDLFVVVKAEYEIGPSKSGECPMGTGLPFDAPAEAE